VSKRPRRRPSRSTLLRRWLAVGALALIAFLYYKPLRTYFATRSALAERKAEVRKLRAEQGKLDLSLARSGSTEGIQAQARALGFVKPGERLFIVKGIGSWKRAEARRRATIARHG
jgi:cell division protein FtsB